MDGAEYLNHLVKQVTVRNLDLERARTGPYRAVGILRVVANTLAYSVLLGGLLAIMLLAQIVSPAVTLPVYILMLLIGLPLASKIGEIARECQGSASMLWKMQGQDAPAPYPSCGGMGKSAADVMREACARMDL